MLAIAVSSIELTLNRVCYRKGRIPIYNSPGRFRKERSNNFDFYGISTYLWDFYGVSHKQYTTSHF